MLDHIPEAITEDWLDHFELSLQEIGNDLMIFLSSSIVLFGIQFLIDFTRTKDQFILDTLGMNPISLVPQTFVEKFRGEFFIVNY